MLRKGYNIRETPARQKARIEAMWNARDRSELQEALALIEDLHAQLDRANAAAVRMAQNARPAILEVTTIDGKRRFIRA